MPTRQKPYARRDKRYVDSPQKLERSGDYIRLGDINPAWLRGYVEIGKEHTSVELGWDARNHYLLRKRGRKAHPEMANYEGWLARIVMSPFEVYASQYRKRKRIVLSERLDPTKRLIVVVEISSKRQIAHQIKTFSFKDEADFAGPTWKASLLWRRRDEA